ncbi:MAG: BT_3928 family protein [Candidatus Limimorpha sp.]
MKKACPMLCWLNIGIAIAAAVGIAFVPAFSLRFLVVLILNLLLPLCRCCTCSKSALTVSRTLVGALFVFSSFMKGVDPLGTKYKILDYLAAYNLQWFNEIALILAVVLILAEFVVGFCLLTNVFPRLAVLGATVLMLFFTLTTLFDALYNIVPDCGCFGTAIKMSNWQTFYKNLVIDVPLLLLVLNNRQLKNRLTWRGQFFLGFLYAVLFLCFEIYNYRHLPVLDFMEWKVGKQMIQETQGEQRIYLTYRNKASGATQEFLSPDYPWDDSVWMSQWEFVDQRTEGDADVLGFSALDEYGNDVTEMLLGTEHLLVFTAHDMSKITEKEWGKIAAITDAADRHGYYVVWVTASNPDYVARLRREHPYLYEVYYGDALEIKTIVRFNPGLILLDKGLVIDKWSAIDFPQGKKLEKLFLN